MKFTPYVLNWIEIEGLGAVLERLYQVPEGAPWWISHYVGIVVVPKDHRPSRPFKALPRSSQTRLVKTVPCQAITIQCAFLLA